MDPDAMLSVGIERELLKAGLFRRANPLSCESSESQRFNYLSLGETGQVAVTLQCEGDAVRTVKAETRVSRSLPVAMATVVLESPIAKGIMFRHDVVIRKAGDDLVLTAESPSKDRSRRGSGLAAIAETLASLKKAAFLAHGLMRRASLESHIVEAPIEVFWGEDRNSAEARTEQTGTEVKRVTAGAIKVAYTDELAGGGQIFGADALDFIQNSIEPVNRAYEWCAGPGFLGFSLLSRGVCRSLCLSDVNLKAVEICNKTIRENGLSDVVTVYHSDCLDQMPIEEKWDLVIGNPPWLTDRRMIPEWGLPIKYQDPDLELHRRFFEKLPGHLYEHSNVVLIETYLSTSPNDFRSLAARAGFHISEVVQHPDPKFWMIYYLRLKLVSQK